MPQIDTFACNKQAEIDSTAQEEEKKMKRGVPSESCPCSSCACRADHRPEKPVIMSQGSNTGLTMHSEEEEEKSCMGWLTTGWDI
jgi:hypothetical protein